MLHCNLGSKMHSPKKVNHRTSRVSSGRSIRLEHRKSMPRVRAKSRKAAVDETNHERSTDLIQRLYQVGLSKYRRQDQNLYQQVSKAAPSMAKYSNKTHRDELLIREALSKNYVFSDLSYVQLRPLVVAFERVKVVENEAIIQQGDDGDYFYIVEEGEVQFEVDGEIVGTAGKGSTFGDLALIYSSPRAATVRTRTKGSVFRVDQRSFRSILVAQAEACEAIKLKRIREVDFLKELSSEDIKKLGNAMSPRMFEKDELLQNIGDPNTFYIIEDGGVDVSGKGALGPGQYFGEGALINTKEAEATAIALKSGMAFTITCEKFWKTIGLVDSLVAKAKDSEKLAMVQCLSPAQLNPSQLESLARFVKDKEYPIGKRFMKQGSPLVNVLYFVRKGAVTITQDGKSFDVGEGAIIGLEPIQSESSWCIKPNIQSALYSAKCKEACVLGVLALKKSRKVFDTILLGDECDELNKLENSMADLAFVRPEKDTLSVAKETSQAEKVRKRSVTEELRLKIKTTDVALEKLKKHSILGEGSFGQVWLVSEEKKDKTVQTYALKIQSKFDLIAEGQAETILKEKEIMTTLKHPFILQLVKTYQDEHFVYMLLELVQGGELFSIISTDKTPILPEASSKFYSLGISEAISFMHSKNIASRDLKPENVLIDREGYPIIIDFGFAKEIAGKSYTLCGTPSFLAPEMISGRGHDCAVDHWALGIMIYEMLTGGKHPFEKEGADQTSVMKSILKDPVHYPCGATAEAADIVDRLLVKDASQRLGSLAGGELDVLEHPWFEGMDLGMLRRRKLIAPWIPPIKGELDVSCFDDWSDLQDRTTEIYPSLDEEKQGLFEGYA